MLLDDIINGINIYFYDFLWVFLYVWFKLIREREILYFRKNS